jgi:hypothetical protein
MECTLESGAPSWTSRITLLIAVWQDWNGAASEVNCCEGITDVAMWLVLDKLTKEDLVQTRFWPPAK